MLKLKTILQSNDLYAFLLFIIIIYLLLMFTLNNKKSIYNGNEKEFSGIVEDYTIKDNKISLTLNSKEKLIGNYYYKSDIPDIMYGDNITIYGSLNEPSNNTVPNNFNYKKYLNNKKIYYTVKANKIIINYRTNNYIYKLKNIISKRIKYIDNNGYIYAFILGKKNYLENYNNYQNIGVSHLFALSGMHVGLISIIILKIFKRFKYKYLILYILLIIYSIITLFPASILRTIIFLMISNLNDYLKLEISSIKRLYITGFILIITNYLIILDISFIYSFISVFALILLSNSKTNFILLLLKNSLIVFLFTLPISLYYFNYINILSIIYNILYIPVVSLIIYPLSLVVFISPYISFILNYLIQLLESITNYLSNINIFTIHMHMNLIYVGLYYLIIYISLKYNKKAFILLVFLFLIIKYSYLIDSNTYIYYLDVGQGDSTLLITPYRKEVILIDTGGNSANQEYKVSDKTINLLHSLSINRIDYLVLTHGDYDHMGDAQNIISNINTNNVIFNCGSYNELETNLINDLNIKKINYYSCINSIDIYNSKLGFLNTNKYDNENDNSNVIYTKINQYKLLLMGDAGIDRESDILDKFNISNIDVLKVGHHGSKTSSSKSFINKIKPKYSIISVGKYNKYGHPNKEVLKTLNKSKIYRTDQDGSVIFKIKNNKLKIETCSP